MSDNEVVNENGYGQEFTSPEFVLSFPRLDEPNWKTPKNDKGSNKYEFTALFDKEFEDDAEEEKWDEMIESIVESSPLDAYEDFNLKTKIAHPFLNKYQQERDGDELDEEKYPGYAGKLYCAIKASPDYRPVLMDLTETGEPVRVPDNFVKKTFYAGCKCICIGQAVYYPEFKRVAFQISMIIKVADGEKLGGGAKEIDVESKIAGIDLSKYGKSSGKPKKTTSKKKRKVVEEEEEELEAVAEDEDEYEEEEEETPPPKKKVKKKPAKKASKSKKGNLSDML